MKLKIKLNSAYLCVKDMNRAIKFYENLLDRKVDEKDKVISKFNLDGFRLCLFAPHKVGEKVTYGDNCLLSFGVNDMDLLQLRLKMLRVKTVYPLTKIGNNQVLEFKDPEENDVEVYSKIR